MAFRAFQTQYANDHANAGQHSAHYCSVEELRYYGVAQRSYQDHAGNYRMVQAPINQSQHRQMDGWLMDMHEDRVQHGAGTGFHYQYRGNDQYISPQQLAERLEGKIYAAKESGAMDNARYRNFLRQSAQRLDMDMRVFNGK